jgi:NADP-dependent 3-hydroxy acid dehydrogenase YdfG
MKPVAVVTGASSGLGATIARALARQGYAVVLAARSAEPLARLAQEIGDQAGGEALAVPTDVTQPAQIEALAQTALDRFGRIDVLVNNAGVAPIHSTASPTDE